MTRAELLRHALSVALNKTSGMGYNARTDEIHELERNRRTL